MEKSKRLLIETLVFAALAIYTGYKSGFSMDFSFTVSKHEIYTGGSLSFLFTIITVIYFARFLYSKFKK